MKKIIYTVIALATVAVGCTKSEIYERPDLGGQEITFDTYLGRAPMTKATSADIATLQTAGKGFDVKAFMHSGTDKPTNLTANDIYMEKAVYWKTATSTAFSYADTETQHYIFSASATQPDAPTTEYSSSTWTCPNGWTEDPQNGSLWMASTTNTNGTWSNWSVEAYKNQAHANGIWEYDGVTYWPDPNSQKYLAFAAWGVNTITASSTDENATHTSNNDAIEFAANSETQFTFKVDSEVASQQDLLVAPFQYGRAINSSATNTTVNINFKHVLSRIGFKLLANQDAPDVEIKISDLNLKGSFASTGTVDITSETPAISATTYTANTEYKLLPETTDFFATYSQDEEVAIYNNKATVNTGTTATVTPATGTDEDNRYMMLIPTKEGTATDYVITVKYTLTDADEETATVTLPTSFKFEAGKSYEFVLKVSTSKIGFYVEVSDWETGDVADSYTLTPETETNA